MKDGKLRLPGKVQPKTSWLDVIHPNQSGLIQKDWLGLKWLMLLCMAGINSYAIKRGNCNTHAERQHFPGASGSPSLDKILENVLEVQLLKLIYLDPLQSVFRFGWNNGQSFLRDSQQLNTVCCFCSHCFKHQLCFLCQKRMRGCAFSAGVAWSQDFAVVALTGWWVQISLFTAPTTVRRQVEKLSQKTYTVLFCI